MVGVPKPSEKNQSDRQKINNRNRSFGKAVEKNVAKLTGGSRVPMSGAIKGSIHQLEGDVRVMFPDSVNTLALIECKGSSGITPKGDKTFTLKKSVLDQAKAEAKIQNAVAAVWVHWLSANYVQDDYVIFPASDFLRLLELAKQAGLIVEDTTSD